MPMKPSSLQVFGQSASWQRAARAVVNPHCQTLHSKELLDLIPHYAGRLPRVVPLFRNEITVTSASRDTRLISIVVTGRRL